uniref:Multifunctional methyltransferase subunit TRM112-like protein n=5 Tax=Timema TaxID=61471 RepID=A0A7R9P5G7_TIMCA|nr:unnamed protein product [Timema californicum]
MKLLTHNMLTSKCIKGVSVGYPLKIEAKDVQVSEIDFNPEFLVRIIPKLDWSAFYKAAESVEVIDGELICPESGRKFPINEGIPNMLLNEDEL